MSYTTIYTFSKDGTAKEYAAIQNSWRSAMAVWSILEGRYLPPYIPEHVKSTNWYVPGMAYDKLVERLGYQPSRLQPGNPKAAEEIWALGDDSRVSRTDRIAIYTTYDKVLAKREDLPEIIAAFRAFDGTTSLPEQADVLETLLTNEDCIAVGWSQTSTCGRMWDAWDWNEETEEDVPYNCLTRSEHFWLFEDLEKGEQNV